MTVAAHDALFAQEQKNFEIITNQEFNNSIEQELSKNKSCAFKSVYPDRNTRRENVARRILEKSFNETKISSFSFS